MVARTPSEEKRHRFAALLAEAARRRPNDVAEKLQTFALLLDQMEEEHILLLDRVVKATLPEGEVHPRLGLLRYAPLDGLEYNAKREGPAWIWLHRLGLLSGADALGMGIEVEGRPAAAVAVTSLGLALHSWISKRA
jgi:hypothetical protein